MINLGTLSKVAIGVGSLGLVLSAYTINKLRVLSSKLDINILTLAKNTKIDIEDKLVEEAVRVAVNKETDITVRTFKNQIESDITREVYSEIHAQTSDIKDKITNRISQEANNIDVSDLENEIKRKASVLIANKFENKLDSLSKDFSDRLESLNKIYSSIEKSVTKKEGDWD